MAQNTSSLMLLDILGIGATIRIGQQISNLSYAEFVLYINLSLQMKTRFQSSSSLLGFFFFINIKFVNYYVRHVPHIKVWLSVQFMGRKGSSQTHVLKEISYFLRNELKIKKNIIFIFT